MITNDIRKSQENENQNILYIQKLKDLMKYIIEQNNKNKEYKISLYKIRGFEPHSIFKEIDNIYSDYINQSDLTEYLNKNNINIEKDIISLFIREFNKQEKDNNLCEQDFVNFFNYDIDKGAMNLGELDFDKNEIKKNFLNLLISEFELIKEKNILINEIKKIKEFSTYEAFHDISNDNKYIDYELLNLFLEEKYNKNEIKELLYRIDMNNDGKINFLEFQDLFFPFQKHLQLEESNDLDFYKNEYGTNNDIKINDKYYTNLNPYKDNTFTEPKIIDYYEKNNENENDDNSISKSDIFLSSNIFNKEGSNNNNLKENNNISVKVSNSYKYDNNILTIKYDENLLKEINERDRNNENNNKDNIESDKINIYNNGNLFDNNENKPKNEIEENQNKLNNYNQYNTNIEENNNSKSDIYLSNINLNQSINLNQNIIYTNDINKNINHDNESSNNSKENQNNEMNKEKLEPEEIIYKKDFTNIFTQKDKIIINLFIDFIHSITLLESRTENLRESISLCNDLSLLDIFGKFDKDKSNLISKDNFNDVCNKEYFLFPSESQIKLLYDRFDLDNDNQLNLEEFMNMISPLNKEYLMLCNKNEYDIDQSISFESKKKVIELLKSIIDNESFIYELKGKLIENRNFNFIYLWGLLMKYSHDEKLLNKKEFNYFLESFGCYLTEYELDIIFCKLSKGNDVIKYDDLYKEIII